MIDGVCTRQVQTGKMRVADGTEHVDLDSMTRGAEKLGAKTAGFKMFKRMVKTMGEQRTTPVSMIRRSADGTTAVFTVTGGMRSLSERIIAIKIGGDRATEITGGVDSRKILQAAEPFTEFVELLWVERKFSCFLNLVDFCKSILFVIAHNVTPDVVLNHNQGYNNG
jgi:hypothetical protein